MASERQDRLRALVLAACEDLGRYGLEPTPEAVAAVASLVVNASRLGAEVDAAAEIARLTRELEEARACCKWEEDNQRRALEYWDGEYGTTLAEEFPYGCDTIEHVAEALIVVRRELEEAREILRDLADDEDAGIVRNQRRVGVYFPGMDTEQEG